MGILDILKQYANPSSTPDPPVRVPRGSHRRRQPKYHRRTSIPSRPRRNSKTVRLSTGQGIFTLSILPW